MQKRMILLVLFFLIACVTVISIPVAFNFGMEFFLITILMIVTLTYGETIE